MKRQNKPEADLILLCQLVRQERGPLLWICLGVWICGAFYLTGFVIEHDVKGVIKRHKETKAPKQKKHLK